jgi:hypothetical protein
MKCTRITTKTYRHDIAEILLKVALSTKNQSINHSVDVKRNTVHFSITTCFRILLINLNVYIIYMCIIIMCNIELIKGHYLPNGKFLLPVKTKHEQLHDFSPMRVHFITFINYRNTFY